jgi:hypothetical protein
VLLILMDFSSLQKTMVVVVVVVAVVVTTAELMMIRRWCGCGWMGMTDTPTLPTVSAAT